MASCTFSSAFANRFFQRVLELVLKDIVYATDIEQVMKRFPVCIGVVRSEFFCWSCTRGDWIDWKVSGMVLVRMKYKFKTCNKYAKSSLATATG